MAQASKKPSENESLTRLEEKVQNGDKDAAVSLGLLYELGLGDVEKDAAKAVTCYEKAAEKGDGFAMLSIADIYQTGEDGVASDSYLSEKWRNDAREKGVLDYKTGVTLLKNQTKRALRDTQTYRPLVLVVDDSLPVLRAQASIVEKNNVEVLTAKDGQEALNLLYANPNIELILTDLVMPVMDGLEFCANVKISKRFSHIPVVMVTTEGSKEFIIKAKAIGVNGWVIKPATHESIKKILNKFLPKLAQAKA